MVTSTPSTSSFEGEGIVAVAVAVLASDDALSVSFFVCLTMLSAASSFARAIVLSFSLFDASRFALNVDGLAVFVVLAVVLAVVVAAAGAGVDAVTTEEFDIESDCVDEAGGVDNSSGGGGIMSLSSLELSTTGIPSEENFMAAML